MTPERLEWLRNRQSFIGGSDIGPIMGESPYSSPWDIYQTKTQPIPDDYEEEPNDQMRVGIGAEPLLAQFFQEDHPDWKCEFNPSTFYHPDIPYFAYNPDGLVTPPGEGRRLYEAKTGRATEEWGIPPDGNIPSMYNDQVQWGMGITGTEKCIVYVMLMGAFPVKYEVDFDWMLFESLKEGAHEFWRKYVVPRVEPDYDHSEAIKEKLQEKWPKGEGVLAEDEIPDNIVELLNEWRTTTDMEKRLKKAKDGLKNQFKDIIRDKDTIRLGGINAVTWRKNKDSEKTDFAAVVEQLRLEANRGGEERIDLLIKEHTVKVEGARPLNVRW